MIVGRKLQNQRKRENYEMLSSEELNSSSEQLNSKLSVWTADPSEYLPSSDSDVGTNLIWDVLNVKADKRSSSLYSVTINSPRPELARKLAISERLLMVAAPSPVFLNSSVNVW